MRVPILSLAPFIPYAAVALGMYGLRSAWAAILLYHGLAIAVLCLCRSGKARLGLQGNPLLYLTTLVFAAGGAVFYALWPLVASNAEIAGKLAGLDLTKSVWPLFAVYFCAVNPIVEELLWRGLLNPGCDNLHRNDVIFGGYHAFVAAAFVPLFWVVPVIAACAFAGWLWRMLCTRSGGLALPWLTHLAADVSIVVAVYLRVYG